MAALARLKLHHQHLSRAIPSTRFIMTGSTNSVVIVAASRTPVGSFNGAFKSLKAPELGSIALKHAVEKYNVPVDSIEEAFFGNVVQAGVGQSPARQVVLGAGLKETTDATTINKVCASGLKAIILGAQAIETGYKAVVAAGGMESMSNAPSAAQIVIIVPLADLVDGSFLIPRTPPNFGKFETIDSLEHDGLWEMYNKCAMGICGENTAAKLSITRESQDEHCIASYKRAAAAWKAGAFNEEIAPVTVKGKKGEVVVSEDEEYKKALFEKIPTLRPAFKKENGTITAANSSKINDGASAVILMSESKAKELGLKPLAKILSYADAGVAPIDFPLAPTVALPHALKKAGLSVSDISLFEINEAFSVVVRAAEQVLQLDPALVNVNGGAVALGHAIGNSGCRIMVTLIHALKEGQYGAAAICNGGGAASAMVIQRM